MTYAVLAFPAFVTVPMRVWSVTIFEPEQAEPTVKIWNGSDWVLAPTE